eukprot:Ihof_evm1s1174 gene=Ihof_evmTU1s1174
MSSEEEREEEQEENEVPMKKQRLHYGSIEEVLKESKEVGMGLGQSAIDRGIEAGNINMTTATQPMIAEEDMDDSDRLGMLAEFDRKRKLRDLVVPTDDHAVRARLRLLGEPITLFGEDKSMRRDRLKDTISRLDESGALPEREWKEEEYKEAEATEVWYHQGPIELKEARLKIAAYSLPRAKERLQNERELKGTLGRSTGNVQELHTRMKNFTNHSSQIGGERPVSCCTFSPNGEMLASTDWKGMARLWDANQSKHIRYLRGHEDRASHIVFHPQSTINQSTAAVNLASCSADGVVCLWDLENETPLAKLKNHGDRVGRVAFHPSGRYLGTTCFDHSWRLWDVETQSELIHQEGHSRGVFGISFQKDGSLVATSGLDAQGRVWDLRTGQCIYVLEGHVKQVLAIDFSPDCHYIATGADDNQIKIWEMRQRKCIYTIPAHSNLISAVKFEPNRGRFLVSSSYDCTVKVWSHPQWSPLRTLMGHAAKILSVDINP